MRNEVKTIKFEDGELLGVRDEQGQVWLGIRKACRDIGLSDTQGRSQVEKIKEDIVLKKGGGNFRLPTNGGEQNVECIKEEFVTLWLAKIALTPAMQEDNPKAVNKLINYQLKAQKVLHEAFTSTEEKRKEFYSDLGLENKIMNLSERVNDVTNGMTGLTEQVTLLIDSATINSRQQQKLLELARCRVNTLLGGARSEKYKQYSRVYFKNMWLGLGHELKVSTYKDLNPVHMSDAINFIKTWDYVG